MTSLVAYPCRSKYRLPHLEVGGIDAPLPSSKARFSRGKDLTQTLISRLQSSQMDESPPPQPAETSPPPPPPQTSTGSPTDFLKGVVGKRVVVRLTSGVDYKGTIHRCKVFTHPN